MSVMAGFFVYSAVAQTPVITVRFANPQNSCATGEYCLDVEFKADVPDQELFGMNVRFFYDEQLLEFVDFRAFEGGYSPVAPDPPDVSTSEPAGPALFNFGGAADFVNGAIQLTNTSEPPIYLDTDNWTKIFQICFTLDGPIMDLDTFCPPVVWDLEQDPANGGFLTGDDGVVITVVDPDPSNESLPADEMVEQFNWQYIGDGSPPYGEPIEIVCSDVNCALPAVLTNFEGFPAPAGNMLSWTVASEFNVHSYSIERSTDVLNWEEIGLVESNASAGTTAEYSFLDWTAGKGSLFYRLVIKDTDGRNSFSAIVTVKRSETPARSDLLLFPNPVTNGSFTLVSPWTSAVKTDLMMFDLQGKRHLRDSFEGGQYEVRVRDFPPGLYLVYASSAAGIATGKIQIME